MNWEVTERLHNGSNQQYEIYTKERGLVFTTLWTFFIYFSAKDRGRKLTDRRRTNSQKSHSHNKTKKNITHTAEKKLHSPFQRRQKKNVAQVWHKKNCWFKFISRNFWINLNLANFRILIYYFDLERQKNLMYLNWRAVCTQKLSFAYNSS